MEPDKRIRFAKGVSAQSSAVTGDQQSGETLSGIEERLGELSRGTAMLLVIAIDLCGSRNRLSHIAETEQSPTGGEAFMEAGLLYENDRPLAR
jgi:hypothetical protein